MLKHEIKYTDYDGDKHEESFYFNLNEVEMIELEVEHSDGLYNWLDKLVKMEDRKEMWYEFKRIVLLSYGVKTPDGKSFMKSPEITTAFEYHAAFNQLMKDITTDEDIAATFINGIMPPEMVKAAEKAAKEEREAKEKKEAEKAKDQSAGEQPPPST